MSINRPLARSPMSHTTLRARLDRFDSIAAELQRLTDQSGTWTDDTSPRKVLAQQARAAKLQAQFRALAAQPEINAAVLKREDRAGYGRAVA